MATTNRELLAMVQERLFRSDLYARLAQWTIRLPPLRERREDIPALASALLGRCDAPARPLTPDLQEALLVHDWPMNVRWLLDVLSAAAIVTPSGALALGDQVREALRKPPRAAARRKPARPACTANANVRERSRMGPRLRRALASQEQQQHALAIDGTRRASRD